MSDTPDPLAAALAAIRERTERPLGPGAAALPIVTRDGGVFCDEDAPDCPTADLAVVEQVPGQLTLGGNLGDDGTCPACGSPDPAERAYVPGHSGMPVDCASDWHDEDARGPGDG